MNSMDQAALLKGYGILYSVQPDRVFVHRIIDPGQDYDRALRLN
ncbi:hypothetical protein ACFSHP_20195 [Novosphingobium panipatense]